MLDVLEGQIAEDQLDIGLSDRIDLVDYYYGATTRIFEAAADVIDIFFMGNDMGSQSGPLVSVPLFDEFMRRVIPRFER